MHTGNEMPIVKDSAIMQEALIEMSSKMLGCVGVVNDDGELVGMITDGDLRRKLSPELITEKVTAIMSRNPKTINPDVLAAEAVSTMNNTGNGITNLFAVKDKKPLGVIHIHDCLRAGVA
jgi:arabinose-5-phosphate isomerase